MNITINKDNWSGEEATISYTETDAGYSFEIQGYVIELVKKEDDYALKEDPFHSYNIVGDDWAEPLDTVCKFSSDTAWVAGLGGDINREDRHPVAAAAKLLFNII